MRRLSFLACISLVALTRLHAQEQLSKSLSLTIYNGDFAVVSESRQITLPDKTSKIALTGVSQRIDPATTQLRPISEPSTHVLEQNFLHDLASSDRLLGRCIDQKIQVLTKDNGRYEGVLVGFDAYQLVLRQGENELSLIPRSENVKSIQLPVGANGPVTRPTLYCLIETGKPGKQDFQLTYQTTGISWRADYNAILSPDETTLDLTGWVTIDNQSGTTYQDAALKLVAGDVEKVESQMRKSALPMAEAAVSMNPEIQERSFFEYRLYSIARATTLLNNETKQIELLHASKANVLKRYVFDAAPDLVFNGGLQVAPEIGADESHAKAAVELEIANTEDNKLGLSLPAGILRVNKHGEGAVEFLGENQINHTASGEVLRINVGESFDISGDRKRTDARVDTAQKMFVETYQIQLRNAKAERVEVSVREHLFRSPKWEITESSQRFEKLDASTIGFNVKIEPEAEAVLVYTVRYTW